MILKKNKKSLNKKNVSSIIFLLSKPFKLCYEHCVMNNLNDSRVIKNKFNWRYLGNLLQLGHYIYIEQTRKIFFVKKFRNP